MRLVIFINNNQGGRSMLLITYTPPVVVLHQPRTAIICCTLKCNYKEDSEHRTEKEGEQNQREMSVFFVK